MDFNSMLKGALPSFGGNGTSLGDNMSTKHLPDGVAQLLPLLGGRFNPLMQTFMVVYEMLAKRLGLDPGVILTLFGFLWAFNKVGRQVYTNVYSLVQEYLMASIHISSNDEIYLHLMKWLARQPTMVSSRSLMAETVGKTAWEDEDESDVLKTRISPDGSGVYLNFSNQEAKAVSYHRTFARRIQSNHVISLASRLGSSRPWVPTASSSTGSTSDFAASKSHSWRTLISREAWLSRTRRTL